MDKKEVILTHKIAVEAKKRGLDHVQCAAEQFKIQHGLDFDPKEFESEERFEHYKSTCGTVFKIVYKGN